MSGFSGKEKEQVKAWLLNSFEAATNFDGSEPSEEKLFSSLSLFDDFARTHQDRSDMGSWERKIVETVFPEHPIDMPTTVDGFLDIAAELYDRLQSLQTKHDSWEIIKNGNAVVDESNKVFVKTDDGAIVTTGSDTPKPYEVKAEPRLAMLIAHLRNVGVNGRSVYMDDLVITKGKVADMMMRQFPYNIVQIPRLNMEIAVCDQIGETTFVKKGTVGSEFWEYLSKDQLKARDDVVSVDRHNDKQWWDDISKFLSGNADPAEKKINVKNWSKKKPNLDMDLIKESLFTHRLETGKWLSSQHKGDDNKIGGYLLEYGPYAEKMTASGLNSALRIGFRGLPGGSSIAQINAEISVEHGLDYVNHCDLEDLDITKIKESLLAHRLETGEWLSNGKKREGDKKRSYLLEYGPYAKQMTVGALDSNLSNGSRGLSGGSSIAQLNAEISDEHDLDYVNHFEQKDFDIAKIRESLLAHRLETGEWLSNGKKREGDKKRSYLLEYGPYAGQCTASALDSALRTGVRGLPGGSSIAELNKEISIEYDLDYTNCNDQEDLDITKVKESLLAHRLETGKWLSSQHKGDDNKIGRYLLEYGPYAEKMTASGLNSALRTGLRGLPGGSSIAQLNAEISDEHDLDYVNHFEQKDLGITQIKESLLAHRLETGKWLSNSKKSEGGCAGSYILEYGPYAGQCTAGALDSALRLGLRGLPGGTSMAKLNAEISDEHGLDYVNHCDQEDLDFEKIKESLLAHHLATGEWLSSSKKSDGGKNGSYILEHGPYAKQMTVAALDLSLLRGNRGLPGGSSIAKINAELKEELTNMPTEQAEIDPLSPE